MSDGCKEAGGGDEGRGSRSWGHDAKDGEMTEGRGSVDLGWGIVGCRSGLGKEG